MKKSLSFSFLTAQTGCALLLYCLLLTSAHAQTADWTQWGGPQRNFVVDAKGLAESWPATGPKRLWSRELGEGHSEIVEDGRHAPTHDQTRR